MNEVWGILKWCHCVQPIWMQFWDLIQGDGYKLLNPFWQGPHPLFFYLDPCINLLNKENYVYPLISFPYVFLFVFLEKSEIFFQNPFKLLFWIWMIIRCDIKIEHFCRIGKFGRNNQKTESKSSWFTFLLHTIYM